MSAADKTTTLSPNDLLNVVAPPSSTSDHGGYIDIAKHIAACAQASPWDDYRPLPPLSKLARYYGTSEATARRAIVHLRNRGYIHTLRSVGNWLTPTDQHRPEGVSGP